MESKEKIMLGEGFYIKEDSTFSAIYSDDLEGVKRDSRIIEEIIGNGIFVRNVQISSEANLVKVKNIDSSDPWCILKVKNNTIRLPEYCNKVGDTFVIIEGKCVCGNEHNANAPTSILPDFENVDGFTVDEHTKFDSNYILYQFA